MIDFETHNGMILS